MAVVDYIPAEYDKNKTRSLFVKLTDGRYVPIQNLRVTGKGRTGGIMDIPTEKELKNSKLHLQEVVKDASGRITARKDATLAGAEIFSAVEQTSFVVFKSVKGSSSVNDPAMLSAQIYDVKDILIPVTIDFKPVPINSINAHLPTGEVRKVVDASDLISFSGDSRVRLTVEQDGAEQEIKFTADSIRKMVSLDDGFVIPKIDLMVDTSRIYEIDASGKAKSTPVGSSLNMRGLLLGELTGKEFQVLDEDGNYHLTDPITEENINEVVSSSVGRYVFVRLKGDTAHTPCPIENLRLDDGRGNVTETTVSANNLATVIGKKIWALGADGRTPYELEPLTANETVPYDTRKVYQETFSPFDACKDENDPSKPQATAMLRLKNGRYVKEADVVQPKCYNFVDPATTNFDAYVVTIGSGEFRRSFVVDKAKVERAALGATISLVVGNEKIEFKKCDAQKVVKSKGGINNSDIVQTSSTKGARAEKCEVLNTRKEGVKLLDGTLDDDTKRDLAERIKKIYVEFMEKYKARQYDLGGELLIQNDPKADGEFEEYLENHRYMLSDLVPMRDSAVNNLKELLNMPEGGFTFDGEQLIGGAKYDYKKGVKNSNLKLGKFVADSIAFAFSGGSLLVLAFPILVPLFALAVPGAAIGIRVYHARKKAKVEAKKDYKYQNKLEHQKETIKDEIFEQLERIIENFKDKQPEFERSLAGLSDTERAQKLNERKQLLLADIALQETKIDFLSASKSGAQFDMVDGKGKVNQANAHEYSQYIKLLGERKTEIENLSKDINDKAEKIAQFEGNHSLTAEQQAELANLRVQRQDAIDLLAVKNNEFQDIRKNYRITGADNHPDKEQQAIRDRIDQAKGFMMVKYFGEKIFDKEDKDLTSAEKAEKAQIEEYVKATEIIVDKHKRDFEYVREATKDKTKKLSRRAWKKKNKAFKAGGLFSRLRRKGKAAKSAATTQSTASAIAALNAMRVPEATAEETAEVAPEVAAEATHTPTRERAKTRTTEKRSLAGLSITDAEKIIQEVCKAMEKLDEIRHAYYSDELIGGEEQRAKKLIELYEYNENVLKAAIKNPPAKKYESLHTKYSADITTAAKRYKDYMIYVENKNVRAL